MGYNPESLKWLGRKIPEHFKSAALSGIAAGPDSGDSYHHSANELPTSSYTRRLESDKTGIDPDANCAIDISMSTSEMILSTKRFYASWKDPNDPRLDKVREVIGTLDGENVIYMDCQDGSEGSADDSHLWHIHIGGLRRYIVLQETAEAIYSVWIGQTYAEYLAGEGRAEGDEFMSALTDEDQLMIRDYVRAMYEGLPKTRGNNSAPWGWEVGRAEREKAQAAQLVAIRSELTAIKASDATATAGLRAALDAVSAILLDGGGSVDVAAINAKIDARADSIRDSIIQQFAAEKAEDEKRHAEAMEAMRKQLALQAEEKDAEIAGLKASLAARK